MPASPHSPDGEIDWRLGNVGQAQDELRLAAQQTIYERLVPLAYPVMYDLGKLPNARDWRCLDGYLTFNPQPSDNPKYLFKEQADGAQFVARFPEAGYTPTIAVGQAHATANEGGARIPGIPTSIADKLFKPVAQGGRGLTRLEFYSPRNGFRYFPSQPSPAEKNTLHQPIGCKFVPDPPGNSG